MIVGAVIAGIAVGVIVAGVLVGRRRPFARGTVGCGEVPTIVGPAPVPCGVRGVAEPAGGRVTAPMSGTTCLWYSVSVMEPQRMPGHLTNPRPIWKVLSYEASHAPFAVRDQTGAVLVNPDGAEATGMAEGANDVTLHESADPTAMEAMSRDAQMLSDPEAGLSKIGAVGRIMGREAGSIVSGDIAAVQRVRVEHVLTEGTAVDVRGAAIRGQQGGVWIVRPVDGTYEIVAEAHEQAAPSTYRMLSYILYGTGAMTLMIAAMVIVASALAG